MVSHKEFCSEARAAVNASDFAKLLQVCAAATDAVAGGATSSNNIDVGSDLEIVFRSAALKFNLKQEAIVIVD
jgi:hypothetical protein